MKKQRFFAELRGSRRLESYDLKGLGGAVGVVNDCSWPQLWASQVGAPGAPRRIPQLQCAPVAQVGRMVEKGQLLHVVRRLQAGP